MELKLHTLVEAADQVEGSTTVEASDEEERVVCPMCGEIFNQSGYKVIVRAFMTQQLVPAAVEEQGQSDWKDGEAPQEQLHPGGVVDKHGVDTQEPTFPNIPIEVATQIGTDELEAEIIPNFIEEVYAMTLESSQGIELIEMEP